MKAERTGRKYFKQDKEGHGPRRPDRGTQEKKSSTKGLEKLKGKVKKLVGRKRGSAWGKNIERLSKGALS